MPDLTPGGELYAGIEDLVDGRHVLIPDQQLAPLRACGQLPPSAAGTTLIPD